MFEVTHCWLGSDGVTKRSGKTRLAKYVMHPVGEGSVGCFGV
jgi:hypothetical protein